MYSVPQLEPPDMHMQLDFFVAVIEQNKLSTLQHQYQWNEIVSLQSKPGFKWAMLLLYIFLLLWQKSELLRISWSCQKKTLMFIIFLIFI